ncbi:hypothetical protein SLEP1_g32179 [Rubroshorea leprosula]|uniref:Tetraspanin-15 n=1 Tax=Rubroshorea leprosula TaxID=152421 RepID=A0AAV5KCF7_9ROSI|nr:hypothetical protein SLEP1_g32179 [Rubroshorea leprosula]
MTDNANQVEGAGGGAGAAVVAEEKVAKEASIPENMKKGKLLGMKHISGLLSIFTFVLSLPILASVMWLLYMRDYDCEVLLRLPRLQIGIGIALIFVFLVSNATLILIRTRLPMVGVMLVMVPLLLMLTMGLAFVGAFKMESRRMPASPMWLKAKVQNNNKWNDIKSCIYDSETCEEMAITSMQLSPYAFSMRKLTPIESGCCQPPPFCGMEALNTTFWVEKDHARSRNHPFDTDCDTWSNNRNILCYDCQSCREGFLSTIQSKWRKLGLFMVIMAVLLIVSHLSVFLATMWEKLES